MLADLKKGNKYKKIDIGIYRVKVEPENDDLSRELPYNAYSKLYNDDGLKTKYNFYFYDDKPPLSSSNVIKGNVEDKRPQCEAVMNLVLAGSSAPPKTFRFDKKSYSDTIKNILIPYIKTYLN